MKRWKWILAAALGVVLLGMTVFGVELFRRTMRQAIEAEDRLHATILVCGVVGDYLKRDSYAAWPRSWEDLRSVPAREWGPFAWPRDAQRVAQLVVVDFGARVQDVAVQDWETFRAIRPNGPAASTYVDVGVEPLLNDIREHAKSPHQADDGGADDGQR